jgi:hypothetical protein
MREFLLAGVVLLLPAYAALFLRENGRLWLG